MKKFKKTLLGIILGSTFLLSACSSYQYGFDIDVLGNVYDSKGTPVSGVLGNFCYTLVFSEHKDESCNPISTNGEGQFSTTLLGTIKKGEGGNENFQGYSYYLEVDGKKYSGKMIQKSDPNWDGGILKSTAVINFTLADPVTSAKIHLIPTLDNLKSMLANLGGRDSKPARSIDRSSKADESDTSEGSVQRVSPRSAAAI